MGRYRWGRGIDSSPSATAIREAQTIKDFFAKIKNFNFHFPKINKKNGLALGAVFLYVFLAVIFVVVFALLRSNDEIVDISVMNITAYPVEVEELPDIIEADQIEEVVDEEDEDEEQEEIIEDTREYIELTADNRANFATIDSCRIKSGGDIEIVVSTPGFPRSDNDNYYLFGLNTYETGIPSHAEYITSTPKELEIYFDIKLNYKQANSRLFKKFVVAVKLDGTFVPVSSARYISNPEAIAKYTGAFPTAASKKGLLVDPVKLHGNELDELGVKQAAYNIFFSRILGPTTHEHYPTISYTYNGKTYNFNGHVISEYDFVFSTLTAKGITTTAILLNDYSPAYPQLIHPRSRGGGRQSPYYAFNAAESAGVECIAAVATFLAERYSGSSGNGKVNKWIVGNEVNARREWNHMERIDVRSYSIEYANAVRVFYNAIKSVTANARIYISLDQQWNRKMNNNPNYDARDVLDELNKYIKSEGNIDWHLAYHPYSVPLFKCQFWESTRFVNNTSSTPFITMGNISVLTDYMRQSHFLTSDGKVRSISLSELGYVSNDGEALQAAAFALAYYIIEANPYITSFLLNRQTDAPDEVAQGLAFGLNYYSGGRKQIFEVFKHIDTPNHEQYTEFAKGIVGHDTWNAMLGR